MKVQRPAVIVLAVLIVAAALVVGTHAVTGRTSDLDRLRQARGASLLPPGSTVLSRREVDTRTNVVARNPAFTSVTAQTGQSGNAVRDYYRTELLARGYTVQLSLGHPVGQLEDTYRRAGISATVDVPVGLTASPVTFTYGLTITR